MIYFISEGFVKVRMRRGGRRGMSDFLIYLGSEGFLL
jgi:hypothetical protein